MSANRSIAKGAAHIFTAVLLSLSAVLGWANTSTSAVIDLAQPRAVTYLEVVPATSVWFDERVPQSGSTVLRTLPNQPFTPVTSQTLDFGFREDTVWLRIPVENRSADTIRRLLSFNSTFMTDLVAVLAVEGVFETLIESSDQEPFTERDIPYRHLMAEFTLPPQAHAEIFVGYTSRGTTFLPISFNREIDFQQRQLKEGVIYAAVYGCMLLMLVYALFHWGLVRHHVYGFYAAYIASAMMYLMHMDGYTHQFLWSQSPQWNAFASLPVAMVLTIFGMQFSVVFLETKTRVPLAHLLIRGIQVGSVVMVLAGVLWDERTAKLYSFWMPAIGTLICITSGIYLHVKGMLGLRFYILGWLSVTIASNFMSLSHAIPGEWPVSLSFDVTKAGILFDAFMFAMAMSDRNRQIRIERDAALRREIAAEQEKRFISARLAETSHDLQQPLLALQGLLSAQNSQSLSKTDREQLTEQIQTLRSLVQDNLKLNTGSKPAQPASESQKSPSASFSLDKLSAQLKAMFEPEMASGRLTFALETIEEAEVQGRLMDAFRVCSNLIQNALTHTPAESPVSVVIRLAPQPTLEVIDQGAGIPSEILERAEQGAEPRDDGHGIGLGIVMKLAQANPFQLNFFNTKRGARAIVEFVPA